MKIINPILILCILIFTSCSTSPHKYPIKAKKYKNDTVTVQTAINLSTSSYLKGCVDRSIELGKTKSFNLCKQKAKKFVNENIIFVLDQD